MKVKEESEKVVLKLNIQKTKIIASGSITSWQIEGETIGTVTDFIFFVSKITADGDSSHEFKWHLLLGRKVMTNLDSILKSRDITLPTKVHLVKVKWSRSVMCDSQRPHGLQPTRLPRPWDFPGKRTGVRCHCLLRLIAAQSVKEIRPEHSLERLDAKASVHGGAISKLSGETN